MLHLIASRILVILYVIGFVGGRFDYAAACAGGAIITYLMYMDEKEKNA